MKQYLLKTESYQDAKFVITGCHKQQIWLSLLQYTS